MPRRTLAAHGLVALLLAMLMSPVHGVDPEGRYLLADGIAQFANDVKRPVSVPLDVRNVERDSALAATEFAVHPLPSSTHVPTFIGDCLRRLTDTMASVGAFTLDAGGLVVHCTVTHTWVGNQRRESPSSAVLRVVTRVDTTGARSGQRREPADFAADVWRATSQLFGAPGSRDGVSFGLDLAARDGGAGVTVRPVSGPPGCLATFSGDCQAWSVPDPSGNPSPLAGLVVFTDDASLKTCVVTHTWVGSNP